MLPDFRVPISLGGESHQLLVQDLPACVFWQGYPDPASEAPALEQGQAQAAWFRHLLVRATVRPALTLDWVLELGEDAWLPTERYLQAVGFMPVPVVAAAEPGALLSIDQHAGGARRETLAEHAAFRGCVPPPHVAALFRLVARAVAVPASTLWLMPASEFFFTYHVHLTDEERGTAPLPEVKR